MLQVARLAPKLLGEATDLVRDFALSQQNDDGGFNNRKGESDLYYTLFGIECLVALQAPLPTQKIASYLNGFSDLEQLDLVHLCALARCWGALSEEQRPATLGADVAERLAEFQSSDGGYHNSPGQESGTVYGCFLAYGAHQDLGLGLPDAARITEFIESMRSDDSAYANQPSMPRGVLPTTAAAVRLLQQMNVEVPESVGPWLAAQLHPEGGFLAVPGAPMPDLLSTAVALHALDGLRYPFDDFKESCLDFIDSLWTNRGSFHGNWTESELDCEYTFYGLLALGHLSL